MSVVSTVAVEVPTFDHEEIVELPSLVEEVEVPSLQEAEENVPALNKSFEDELPSLEEVLELPTIEVVRQEGPLDVIEQVNDPVVELEKIEQNMDSVIVLADSELERANKNIVVPYQEPFPLMELMQRTPLEVMERIFINLTYRDANNLRQTCSVMEKLYFKYRMNIRGPICDVLVTIIKTEFIIRIMTNEENMEQPLILPEEDWDKYLRNVTCENLNIDIGMDEKTVDDLRQFFSHWTIHNLHYAGPSITPEKIRLFEEMSRDSLTLNLETFEDREIVARKLEKVYILRKTPCFFDLINHNRNITKMHIRITMATLESALPRMKFMLGKINNIVHWEIDLYEVPFFQEEEVRALINQFVGYMEQLSLVKIRVVVEDLEFDYMTIDIRNKDEDDTDTEEENLDDEEQSEEEVSNSEEDSSSEDEE